MSPIPNRPTPLPSQLPKHHLLLRGRRQRRRRKRTRQQRARIHRCRFKRQRRAGVVAEYVEGREVEVLIQGHEYVDVESGAGGLGGGVEGCAESGKGGWLGDMFFFGERGRRV